MFTPAWARLGWPSEPYAKGIAGFARPFLGRNLIRLREAMFWEEQEHFGATTRRRPASACRKRFPPALDQLGHIRREETEGVRWFSNLTLYRNLGNGRAFAYQGGVSGESDHEVGIMTRACA